MSLTDKVTGKLKQAAGDIADDPALRREGKREERKGKAKDELARNQESCVAAPAARLTPAPRLLPLPRLLRRRSPGRGLGVASDCATVGAVQKDLHAAVSPPLDHLSLPSP